MKKQKFWKVMRDKKSIRFDEAQGYVIDLTDNYGYTVKIALEFVRAHWRATHYESGLLIMPHRVINEFGNKSNEYKSRDELIKTLKTLDFKKYVHGNTFIEDMKEKLNTVRNK